MCAAADHWVCSSAFKNSTANFKVSWSLSKDYFCKSDNGISYLLNQCTILQISENDDLFKMSIKRRSAALNSSGHACSRTPQNRSGDWERLWVTIMSSVIMCSWQISCCLRWAARLCHSLCLVDVTKIWYVGTPMHRSTGKDPVREEWAHTHWSLLSAKVAELCSLGSSGVLRECCC